MGLYKWNISFIEMIIKSNVYCLAKVKFILSIYKLAKKFKDVLFYHTKVGLRSAL